MAAVTFLAVFQVVVADVEFPDQGDYQAFVLVGSELSSLTSSPLWLEVRVVWVCQSVNNTIILPSDTDGLCKEKLEWPN